MNFSWNVMSNPASFDREKTIPKCPELVVQPDASTDNTAVHFRSSVGGYICENLTSSNARVGLHIFWPDACVSLARPIPPASSAKMHDRYMCLFSFRFDL
jgi:hypothetical protein